MSTLKRLLERELAKLDDNKSELARRLKIPYASLFNYLYGDIEPQKKTLKKIADYFDKPLSYFDEDSPNTDATFVREETARPLYTDREGRGEKEELRRLINMLIEIMTSGDEVVKTALRSNLVAFHEGIKNFRELEGVKRDIEALKQIVHPNNLDTEAKEQ